jgi:hypothetical protein
MAVGLFVRDAILVSSFRNKSGCHNGRTELYLMVLGRGRMIIGDAGMAV